MSATDPDSVQERPRARGLRTRTVVFGLVLLIIAAAVLAATLGDADIDATAFLLVLLIGAGVALLVGGVQAAVRDARRSGD